MADGQSSDGPAARSDMTHGSIRPRLRDERRRYAWGLAAALLLHLLVVLFGGERPMPRMAKAAAGPDAGDDLAARGGMQAMQIRARAPRPVPRPLDPVFVEVDVEALDIPDETLADLASLEGLDPGPPGPPGLPDGLGSGGGGEDAEGQELIQLPTPRGMIIPPTNSGLSGVEVRVWVFVDEVGRVVPDSTRLDPPTRDRGFNRQLIREAAEWAFLPGTLDGKPVGSWFNFRASF